MSTKLSQSERILNHLKKGKKLTPVGALARFKCMRLAPRIQELRNEGWDIKTVIIRNNGKKYARYEL